MFQILMIPITIIFQLIPRSKKIWLFGSWRGLKKNDNTHYLFNYILKYEKSIKPIWITKNKDIKGENIYYHNSIKGIWYSLRAKVAFVTHDRDDINSILSYGAIFISLTHGIPLKKIGLDANYQRFSSFTNIFDKYIRNNLPSKKSSDYIFVGNFASVERFSSATRLNKDKIICMGYSRWEGLLENNNTLPKENKKILYAPTHRENGNKVFKPFDLEGFDVFIAAIRQMNYEFIFKPHPSLKYSIPDKYKNVINIPVDKTIDANFYLKNADILITDYSSILYDYCILARPIISFVFDLEEYSSKDAGLYDDYKNLVPGPICIEWSEVLNFVINPHVNYDFFNKNYPMDLSQISKNIVEKTRELI